MDLHRLVLHTYFAFFLQNNLKIPKKIKDNLTSTHVIYVDEKHAWPNPAPVLVFSHVSFKTFFQTVFEFFWIFSKNDFFENFELHFLYEIVKFNIADPDSRTSSFREGL